MKWFKFLRKKQKTDLIFTTVIHNSKIKILAMQLPINRYMKENLTLVDHATQQPIDAFWYNIELISSDPNIFSVEDVDNDGYADIKGISVGTAILTVNADASYTDGNTHENVIRPKTATIDVTVTEPGPEEQQTDMIITLSNPQVLP